jgi:hypothetical protein
MKNKIIEIDENTVAIEINCRTYGIKHCLIDREDIPIISAFNWRLSWITKRNKTHYVVSSLRGKTIPMHRLILGFPDKQIDHTNHEGWDNRKENLREVTPSQNCLNKKVQSNNKLGIKGVQKRTFLNGITKYRVRIRVKGKLLTIGHTLTIEEAIELRKEADEKYFKLFS